MAKLDWRNLPEIGHVQQETATQSEETPRAQNLLGLLKPCLPPMGHRHGFYLALTGFFAKQFLPLSEAKAIVIGLCTYSGANDKIAERLALCEASYSKHDAGEQVGGEEGLLAALRVSVGAAANDIVDAIVQEITPIGKKTEKAPPRAKLSQGRTHGKLSKLTLTDLAFDLANLPEWQGVIAYDIFKHKRVARHPPIELDAEKDRWSDADSIKVRSWLEQYRGVTVSKDLLEEALTEVADENKVNSLADWLETLPPGAPGAIEKLADVIGLTLPIERKMLRKWLLSLIARAYKPGVYVKSALVLQGKQNVGKSALLKILAGRDRHGILRGDLSDSKRVGEIVAGKWIVELEEAHSLNKTDVLALKGILSDQDDDYRGAYERHAVKRPRTCAFAVTTNDDRFLNDTTGNVRYWCVLVPKRIDLAKVEAIRDAVLAEARDAYKAGEPIYFTDPADEAEAEERAKEFQVIDPLDEWVEANLAGKEVVSVTELIELAGSLGASFVAQTAAKERNAANRFGACLRRLGCEQRKIKGNSRWVVPAEIAKKEPLKKNGPRYQPHSN